MDDEKQQRIWRDIEAAVMRSATEIASIVSSLDEPDRAFIESQLDGIIRLEDLNEKIMMKPSGKLH